MKESNENKIKVAEFVDNTYDQLNRIAHGISISKTGYCLLEKDGKIYLVDILSEEVETGEGSYYELGIATKHDYVWEILSEFNIPSGYGMEDVDLQYKEVQDIKLITEDGQLVDVDEELYDIVMQYKSISATTDVNEEIIDVNNPGDGIYISEDEDDYGDFIYKANIDIDNFPYGDVQGYIKKKNEKFVVGAYGKEFDLEELINSRYKKIDDMTQEELVEKIKEQQQEILEKEQKILQMQENIQEKAVEGESYGE